MIQMMMEEMAVAEVGKATIKEINKTTITQVIKNLTISRIKAMDGQVVTKTIRNRTRTSLKP
jgi:NAD/NADP transhydrogenase alpha subunit